MKKERIVKIWNFLETKPDIVILILNAVPLMFNVVSFFLSLMYSKELEKYYGIDERYFQGREIFFDKVRIFVVLVVLMAFIALTIYFNDKMNKWLVSVYCCVVMTIFLLHQILACALVIRYVIQQDWLIKIIDSNFVIVALIVLSFVVSYMLTYRKKLKKDTRFAVIKMSVLLAAALIYTVIVAFGIVIRLTADISDKKDYEVIDNSKVVITEYEGKFLVMDCSVQEEVLYIDKGKYSFMEMNGVEIVYHQFKDVELR